MYFESFESGYKRHNTQSLKLAFTLLICSKSLIFYFRLCTPISVIELIWYTCIAFQKPDQIVRNHEGLKWWLQTRRLSFNGNNLWHISSKSYFHLYNMIIGTCLSDTTIPDTINWTICLSAWYCLHFWRPFSHVNDIRHSLGFFLWREESFIRWYLKITTSYVHFGAHCKQCKSMSSFSVIQSFVYCFIGSY